jgi:hypothetical protein
VLFGYDRRTPDSSVEEAIMRILIVAFAAGLCLAAATVSASAQGPSYESRGYGGPLYVGPNFQQGGQHAPPVYGQGRSKSERATTRRSHTAKSRSAPATREAKTEKPSSTPKSESADAAKSAGDKKADSENSTISSAALQSDSNTGAKAEVATPVTCKRYVAAVGQTVTVPCD